MNLLNQITEISEYTVAIERLNYMISLIYIFREYCCTHSQLTFSLYMFVSPRTHNMPNKKLRSYILQNEKAKLFQEDV